MTFPNPSVVNACTTTLGIIFEILEYRRGKSEQLGITFAQDLKPQYGRN
jgi:hypothetical protein